MAYTVRTTEKGDKIIQAASNITGTKTASKTMIAACAKLPAIDKELNETKEALRQIEKRYYTLVKVIQERHKSERKVQHLFEEICNVILPEDFDDRAVLQKL